jgi:hypothetical protein
VKSRRNCAKRRAGTCRVPFGCSFAILIDGLTHGNFQKASQPVLRPSCWSGTGPSPGGSRKNLIDIITYRTLGCRTLGSTASPGRYIGRSAGFHEDSAAAPLILFRLPSGKGVSRKHCMNPRPPPSVCEPIPAGGVSIILEALALDRLGLPHAGPSFNRIVANTAVGFVLYRLALILPAGERRRTCRPGPCARPRCTRSRLRWRVN